MKKFVKAFLTMAMCFSMLSSNALAAESEIPGLSVLADEYISVSVSNTEIVYSNLQEFYVAAKEEIPAISDIELAEYVMDYTGQSYDGLSDETILETLDFTEISTVEQIFRAKEDGTVEELTPEAHIRSCVREALQTDVENPKLEEALRLLEKMAQ